MRQPPVESSGETLSAVTPMLAAVEGSTDVVVAQPDLVSEADRRRA
ncbi:hypothetical protein [Nocardia sp. NPDC049526]